MIVFTDNRSFAEGLTGTKTSWLRETRPRNNSALANLANRFFQGKRSYSAKILPERFWTNAFLLEKASQSQFDLVAEALSSSQALPGRFLCCAGSGEGFHGQHNRPWVALPGNLHLTALFTPNQKMANCGIGFTVVGVVTVLQVIDSLGIHGAQVKWVNDIMLEEAKVGGVLVHIKTQGERVSSALLGIGLNIETIPDVKPDRFVPRVAALKSFATDQLSCTHGHFFRGITRQLAENYNKYVQGHFAELLDAYRDRSLVCGRKVAIYEDSDTSFPSRIAGGKVTSIGENLELVLEGNDAPIWKGRLVLEENGPC